MDKQRLEFIKGQLVHALQGTGVHYANELITALEEVLVKQEAAEKVVIAVLDRHCCGPSIMDWSDIVTLSYEAMDIEMENKS